jgi:hypothetical protein
MSSGAEADRAARLTILEAVVVALARPSLCARGLKHCASSMYGLGMLAAAVPIVVSLCYVIVVPEPLWQRMMTVVVIGLVPSSIVLILGTVVGAVLAMGSMLVDPASILFRRLMPPVGRAVMVCSAYGLGLAVTAARRAAKWIGRLIVAAWRAWEDVCWAGCQRVRAASRAWSTTIAHAVVCCARRSISWLRRAGAATAFRVLRGSGAALNILMRGFRVFVDKLEALGCVINAVGSTVWMAVTFPVRLLAGILLRSMAAPGASVTARRLANGGINR